jgi:hypothetical protein
MTGYHWVSIDTWDIRHCLGSVALISKHMVAVPCSAVSVYIHGHVGAGRLASLLWHWMTLDLLLQTIHIQKISVASLGLQYLSTQALGSLSVLGLVPLDSINVAWIRWLDQLFNQKVGIGLAQSHLTWIIRSYSRCMECSFMCGDTQSIAFHLMISSVVMHHSDTWVAGSHTLRTLCMLRSGTLDAWVLARRCENDTLTVCRRLQCGLVAVLSGHYVCFRTFPCTAFRVARTLWTLEYASGRLRCCEITCFSSAFHMRQRLQIGTLFVCCRLLGERGRAWSQVPGLATKFQVTCLE